MGKEWSKENVQKNNDLWVEKIMGKRKKNRRKEGTESNEKNETKR